jgi:hypothetical protein
VILEVRDDLHRSHLRRAGDSARREARAEQVEGGDVSRQLSRHLRDEVGDVREPLRLEEALDVDGPGYADTGEVVTAEVDEHHVLGPVLLGGEQSLGVAGPGCGRAGDRVQARAAALELDERLRR